MEEQENKSHSSEPHGSSDMHSGVCRVGDTCQAGEVKPLADVSHEGAEVTEE